MSYAGIFWLPVEAVACLAGLLLLALRRPLGAAILGALVSVALLPEVRWGNVHAWSPVPGSADGVLAEHLLAAGVHARADWALGMLAWSLPPLLLFY